MRTNLRAPLRLSLAAPAATTLLVGLTACGSDEPSEQAADETTSSSSEEPDATADADETDESSDEGEEVAEGEEIDAADFLEDFQAGVENSTTAHMTMSTGMGGMNIDAEGDIDYQTEPASMSMTMAMPSMGGEIEMRFVDGIFYMNMGQQSKGKFIKMDPNDPNSPMGDISELTDSMDPVRQFEQFAEGVQKVVYVGEEDVDGESTEHYVLTLDTSKVESLKDAGTAGIPKELDYDLWLDDDDRIRQMQLDLGDTGSVEVHLTDWDEPVDIEAPPADQIMQMPSS
jgi:hypothetical protein